jgi:Plavaka transposase
VFQSLKRRSHNGEAHRCADGINRVLHPGILIESQDAEEAAYFCACRAAYFCACRAASANHPCPKCLVSQPNLHRILGNFELRTPQSMQAVLARVSNAKTKTAKEKILKDNGMHNIQVSLPSISIRLPFEFKAHI